MQLNQPQQQRPSSALVAAVIASAILPFIPVLKWALLPFDYLNTQFHEAFHALAAVASGGMVSHIEIFTNAEGVTWTAGGIAPLIQSAGYIGASLLGALMIGSSVKVESARRWLTVLGVALALILILWVRGNPTGLVSGIFWSATLFILGTRLPAHWSLFAVQFLGVQQCLNSLKSLRDLIYLSAENQRMTDAANIAESTHIPAIVWAVLWGVIGFAAMGVAVHRVFSHQPKSRTI